MGIFILTIVAVSAGLLYELKKGNDFSEMLARDHMAPIVFLGDIQNLVQDNRSQALLGLQHDESMETSKLHDHGVEMHLDRIAASKAKIDQAFEGYAKHALSGEEAKLFQNLKEAREDFVTNGLLKVVAAIKSDDYHIGTIILLKDMNPRTVKVLTAADALSVYLRTTTDKEIVERKEIYTSTQNLIIAILLITCGIVTFVSISIANAIIRPMKEAVSIAKTIASGDLTLQISAQGDNETGQLLQALGEMSSSLRKVVGQVRLGSDSIATATHQIAAGNADLAARTEEQAAALEEAASHLGDLNQVVVKNATNSDMANVMFDKVSGVAEEAGTSVGKVIDNMEIIGDGSRKIADIISVIDGIAFQTNILALNAAVEAARAGDQGRGFAVVATEVRALAQRSAAAAKEIKTLILGSSESVESGTEMVKDAGRTMDDVVHSVRQAATLINEIAHAAAIQRTSFGEVNSTLSEMDSVTQQNAALVEEAAAAAESLASQAEKLKEVVSVFRI